LEKGGFKMRVGKMCFLNKWRGLINFFFYNNSVWNEVVGIVISKGGVNSSSLMVIEEISKRELSSYRGN